MFTLQGTEEASTLYWYSYWVRRRPTPSRERPAREGAAVRAPPLEDALGVVSHARPAKDGSVAGRRKVRWQLLLEDALP